MRQHYAQSNLIDKLRESVEGQGRHICCQVQGILFFEEKQAGGKVNPLRCLGGGNKLGGAFKRGKGDVGLPGKQPLHPLFYNITNEGLRKVVERGKTKRDVRWAFRKGDFLPGSFNNLDKQSMVALQSLAAALKHFAKTRVVFFELGDEIMTQTIAEIVGRGIGGVFAGSKIMGGAPGFGICPP